MPVENTATRYALIFTDGEVDEMPEDYTLKQTIDYSRSLLEPDDDYEPGLFDHTVMQRRVNTITEDWTPAFISTQK